MCCKSTIVQHVARASYHYRLWRTGMGWYRVTKTIKGHKYLYEQQTYREGGKVKTRNRYLGPAGSDRSSGSSKSAVTTTDSSLLHGAASFGQAMLKQFDAGQWGRDVAAQM